MLQFRQSLSMGEPAKLHDKQGARATSYSTSRLFLYVVCAATLLLSFNAALGAGEAGLGDARVSDDVYPTAAIEINGLTPNGPVLANNAFFGISVASMGDLDGDGVPDLAVGAEFDNASGTYRGAVHVMLMNADGTVKSTSEINGATPNGPVLPDYGNFGISVASMGDLDGDGVPDLAAGSTEMGAVHIMLMNADGTVKSTSEINGATPNGPVLATHDHFGSSITLLGDLDGDGVPDLAVGAYHDNAGGTEKGAVYVMLMNGDGTVKSTSEINGTTPNGPVLANHDYFGRSMASLGDLDGDGVPDLAVGAYFDNAGGINKGAVHIMLMNGDGTVKSTSEINGTTPNGPVLTTHDHFGAAVASMGDLDGDGVPDLAVGAYGDDGRGVPGDDGRGAVHVMLMNADGTVKSTSEINGTTPNGPVLKDNDNFGRSVASMGDFDGDGVTDLVAGIYAGSDAGGINRGAVHIVTLGVVPVDRTSPPPAPANLTATSTTDSVTLTWDDPDDDSITGYKILSRMPAVQTNLSVLVADTGSADNTYTVPDLESGTVYIFLIIAISDHGESEMSDPVRMSTLPNSPPVADAGLSQIVQPGNTVTLNGTGSSDPDGHTIIYSWNQTSGSVVALSGADTDSPSFEAPATTDHTILTFELTVSDGRLASSDAVNITVKPDGPPAIILAGSANMTIQVGSAYTEPGYTATDDIDGNLTANVTITGTVDSSASGTYALQYDVTDSSGNTAIPQNRTVHVTDTTPPTITLAGSANMTIQVGSAYTEPGYTATDNYDGDITKDVTVTGTVDSSASGTYALQYDVTDSSGNTAIPQNRTVHVTDTTPPTITLAGSANMTIQVGSAYTEPGYTATDNYDGDITKDVTVTGTVDSSASGTYALQYDVTDSSGNTAIQQVRTVSVVAPPPPAAPTGLQVTSTTTSVTLTWDDPSDDSITGYKILSRMPAVQSSLSVLVADTGSADNTYTVNNLEPDTMYAFRVVALSDHGKSEVSKFININTEKPPPPAAPTGLQVTSTTTSVTLTWDDPSDDSITGYKILSRMPAVQSSLSVLVADTGSADNTYTVNNLEPDTMYAFRVVALSDHGKSEVSKFININTEKPPPPAAPTGLQVTSTTTSVTLTWDDPSDDSITGYKILSRMPAVQSSLSVLVADTGSADNTYTVNNLEPDTMYAFRVVALSDHGKSEVSKFININTEKPPPPAAPTGLQVTSTTTSVTLTWDDPSDDSITGYKILSRMPAVQSSLSVLRVPPTPVRPQRPREIRSLQIYKHQYREATPAGRSDRSPSHIHHHFGDADLG